MTGPGPFLVAKVRGMEPSESDAAPDVTDVLVDAELRALADRFSALLDAAREEYTVELAHVDLLLRMGAITPEEAGRAQAVIVRSTGEAILSARRELSLAVQRLDAAANPEPPVTSHRLRYLLLFLVFAALASVDSVPVRAVSFFVFVLGGLYLLARSYKVTLQAARDAGL